MCIGKEREREVFRPQSLARGAPAAKTQSLYWTRITLSLLFCWRKWYGMPELNPVLQCCAFRQQRQRVSFYLCCIAAVYSLFSEESLLEIFFHSVLLFFS